MLFRHVKSRANVRSVAVAIILLFVILIAGCSQATATTVGAGSSIELTPANGFVQSNGSGQVTIDVKWMGTHDDLLTFAVAMNTHSVNLDSYDLSEISILRDSYGNEYQPVRWDSAQGGHHRNGTLAFSDPDISEQGNISYLELIIQGVDKINERTFRWQFNS